MEIVPTQTTRRAAFREVISAAVISLVLLLGACGPPNTPEATESPGNVETSTPAATETPVPTATPEPVAATVNGEGITLAVYEAHLARFEAAQAKTGTLLATEEAQSRVLEDLIDRLLLAQGARQAGFVLDENMVAARLSKLVDGIGGQEALDTWLAANFYTRESFRQDLSLEIEAGWMREQIAASVPEAMEQVEARQILTYTQFEAERLLNQLENGTPFDTVLANNDPSGLGYLGWFPRGYLLHPAVEAAAFSLEVGEHSQVIETEIGYHIVQVIDKDPNRELTPDAHLTLQMQALQTWIDEKHDQSQIEIRFP